MGVCGRYYPMRVTSGHIESKCDSGVGISMAVVMLGMVVVVIVVVVSLAPGVAFIRK